MWRRAEKFGKLDARGGAAGRPLFDVLEFYRVWTTLLHGTLDFCSYTTLQILRFIPSQVAESYANIYR